MTRNLMDFRTVSIFMSSAMFLLPSSMAVKIFSGIYFGSVAYF
jgi:hypothetical protein